MSECAAPAAQLTTMRMVLDFYGMMKFFWFRLHKSTEGQAGSLLLHLTCSWSNLGCSSPSQIQLNQCAVQYSAHYCYIVCCYWRELSLFVSVDLGMISNVPCTAQKLHQQVQYELNVHQIYKAATCRRHAAAEAAAQVSPSAKTVRPISRQPSYLQPATGYVPREADVAHVPGDFQQLLDSVVTAYQAACGPRLAGVYLRGSLPRGLFLPGISDVDTFAVVLPTTTADGSSSSNGDTNGSSSSTDSSLQDLQQAVQRLSTPAVQAHQHLGYTKVGGLCVPPSCAGKQTHACCAVQLQHASTKAACWKSSVPRDLCVQAGPQQPMHQSTVLPPPRACCPGCRSRSGCCK